MQLLCVVVQSSEKLEKLLMQLSVAGLSGATVLDCRGMGELLMHSQKREDIPFYDLLSNLLDDEGGTGKLVLMVLSNERIEKARCIIRDCIGGLDKPNSGIMFGVPLTFTEGIREV